MNMFGCICTLVKGPKMTYTKAELIFQCKLTVKALERKNGGGGKEAPDQYEKAFTNKQ